MPKTASVVLLDGQRAYWDYSALAVTFRKVNDRDFYLGRIVGDCASADTTCVVNLNVDPAYDIDIHTSPFLSVPTGTQAVGAFGFPKGLGGANSIELTATSEAQCIDLLSVGRFSVDANPIVEAEIRIPANGSASAVDFNIGRANGTSTTDADAITKSVFFHIDGGALDILAESDDGTTEVAATDTTVNATKSALRGVTEDLSDEEWEAMMSWFYQAGWYIRDWCREYVDVDQDDDPPRTFIPPRVLAEAAAAEAAAALARAAECAEMVAEDAQLQRRGYSRKCSAAHQHRAVAALAAEEGGAAAAAVPSAQPKEKKQKPAAAPIPRFCRAAGACAEAGCRFTHGDTIPVQNKVCAFDGRCAGDKRATCVFLHPSEGEVWTAELVRHRPVVAAAAAAE
jgi:hypothetical protein